MRNIISGFVFILCCITAITAEAQKGGGYTKLTVTNNKNDSVEVYVTFAAQNNKNKCCPAPAGFKDFKFLKAIPGNALMAKFKLGPKSTQVFDPKGKCFSGNICFYIEPQCPVSGADFNHGKEGTSIAEFTLNPNQGCGEAFDISCVNGVNSFIQMVADKNGGWVYGPKNTPVHIIHNKGLKDNKGLPGVYPVNCTDCIRLVGSKPCAALPLGPPQKERICNIKRSGMGGTLQVILTDAKP